MKLQLLAFRNLRNPPLAAYGLTLRRSSFHSFPPHVRDRSEPDTTLRGTQGKDETSTGTHETKPDKSMR